MPFKIKVNGVDRTVDVDGDTPLLWVLRDVLGMTGTKFGCGMALCGACTVQIDGVETRSRIPTIDNFGTSEITTIEAIGTTAAGAKIQKAWLDQEVVQCGYCQSGQIMSASALLASNPHPSDADIDDAMSGTSAAAAPMSASAKQSNRQPKPRGQEAYSDPRSPRFPRRRPWPIAISERPLPAQVAAGRSCRGRRPAAEPETAVCKRRCRSG